MRKLGIFLLVLLNFFSQAQENPVHWKFEAKKLSDCDYELIFKAKIDEPWHIYSLVKAD